MRNLVFCCLLVLLLSTVALADDVFVATTADPVQDDWILEGWVGELSTNPHGADQLITSSWEYTQYIPCPIDYQGGANVEVTIVNMTNRSFGNHGTGNYYDNGLYYVGDVHDDGSLETTFTNIDEWLADVTPGHNNNVPGMAFKIDDVGLNQPLVYESMGQNKIFEPGETWKFVIQEYANIFALPASALGSVGPNPFGAIAQASMLDMESSGSIVPEPATLCLFGLGGLLLGRRKR